MWKMSLKGKANSHSAFRNAFYATFAKKYQITRNWGKLWNNRKGEFHPKKTNFKKKKKVYVEVLN